MSGKHASGEPSDFAPGTDHGDAFETLTPAEKAAEFDASDNNPRAYAERNFGAGQSHADQWSQQRAEQRAQQERNR